MNLDQVADVFDEQSFLYNKKADDRPEKCKWADAAQSLAEAAMGLRGLLDLNDEEQRFLIADAIEAVAAAGELE